MKCSEVQNRLSAFHDRELAEEERHQVAAHLAQCDVCSGQLAHFEKLGSLAAQLPSPQSPDTLWSKIEEQLTDATPPARREGSTATPPVSPTARPKIRALVALAAGVLVALLGIRYYWGDHHDHQEMVRAMKYLVAHPNSPEATRYLAHHFDGQEVTADHAITLVGYRPIATDGLPDGYTVKNIQILDMPCCRCTQTVCERPDQTRFFVFEHENEEPGWFKHRNHHTTECCCKTCRCIELNNGLAMTWKEGPRYVTLLGVRDEAEAKEILKRLR